MNIDEIRAYMAQVKENQEWFRSRRLGDSYNTAYDDDCDGCEMIGAASDLLAAYDALVAECDALKSRTCATCNAWSPNGVCQMVFPAVRWVHAPTAPTFGCAAWSPKQEAAE